MARAMAAIRDGQCKCVLVLSADAPTTASRANYGAWRDEFQAPQGVVTPPAAMIALPFLARDFGIDGAHLPLALIYCTLIPTMSAATRSSSPTVRLKPSCVSHTPSLGARRPKKRFTNSYLLDILSYAPNSLTQKP